MIISNPKAKRTLKEQLDDLDYCLKTCLERVHDPDAYRAMSGAVCAVAAPIIEELQDNLQGYKVELPISVNEHKGIVWMKESEKYRDFAEDFKNHELTGDTFPPIVCSLETLSELMKMVKQSFQQLSQSSLYADYCEREYKYFKDYNWSGKLDQILDDLTEDYTSDDWRESSKAYMEDYLDKLKEVAPKAVDKEKRLIYHEALGHKLWGLNHKQKDPVPVEETLRLVAAAEYFGESAEDPVTFLAMKVNPNDTNESIDGLSHEMRELIMKKQKVQQIVNARLNSIVDLTCKTSEYYGPKLSDEFIKGMYTTMFADECLTMTLCDKFSEYPRVNSICRVVGELYNAKLYNGAKAKTLGDCMKVRKPDVDSRTRYIRDHFAENDELGMWIRKYLKENIK